MKKFKVAVSYQMWGTYEIEAETLEEAQEKALEEMPLPTDAEYVDDSTVIDEYYVGEFN